MTSSPSLSVIIDSLGSLNPATVTPPASYGEADTQDVGSLSDDLCGGGEDTTIPENPGGLFRFSYGEPVVVLDEASTESVLDSVVAKKTIWTDILRSGLQTMGCDSSLSTLLLIVGSEGFNEAVAVHKAVIASYSGMVRDQLTSFPDMTTILMDATPKRIIEKVVRILYNGAVYCEEETDIRQISQAMEGLGMEAPEHRFSVCGALVDIKEEPRDEVEVEGGEEVVDSLVVPLDTLEQHDGGCGGGEAVANPLAISVDTLEADEVGQNCLNESATHEDENCSGTSVIGVDNSQPEQLEIVQLDQTASELATTQADNDETLVQRNDCSPNDNSEGAGVPHPLEPVFRKVRVIGQPSGDPKRRVVIKAQFVNGKRLFEAVPASHMNSDGSSPAKKAKYEGQTGASFKATRLITDEEFKHLVIQGNIKMKLLKINQKLEDAEKLISSCSTSNSQGCNTQLEGGSVRSNPVFSDKNEVAQDRGADEGAIVIPPSRPDGIGITIVSANPLASGTTSIDEFDDVSMPQLTPAVSPLKLSEAFLKGEQTGKRGVPSLDNIRSSMRSVSEKAVKNLKIETSYSLKKVAGAAQPQIAAVIPASGKRKRPSNSNKSKVGKSAPDVSSNKCAKKGSTPTFVEDGNQPGTSHELRAELLGSQWGATATQSEPFRASGENAYVKNGRALRKRPSPVQQGSSPANGSQNRSVPKKQDESLKFSPKKRLCFTDKVGRELESVRLISPQVERLEENPEPNRDPNHEANLIVDDNSEQQQFPENGIVYVGSRKKAAPPGTKVDVYGDDSDDDIVDRFDAFVRRNTLQQAQTEPDLAQQQSLESGEGGNGRGRGGGRVKGQRRRGKEPQ